MISGGPFGEDEADVDLVASLFILVRALLDIRDGESSCISIIVQQFRVTKTYIKTIHCLGPNHKAK